MPLSPITPFYNQSVLHHLLYVVFRTFSPKEFCRNLASFLDEYMPVSMLEIKKYDNFIISKISYPVQIVCKNYQEHARYSCREPVFPYFQGKFLVYLLPSPFY